MERQLTEGIQRPHTEHQGLLLPSGHPNTFVAETHLGSAMESMHRESALVSSTWMLPEGMPFPLKSSRSFYSQHSWADSTAWPFEEPVVSSPALPFNTPNVSRSNLFVAPPSTHQTLYSTPAGASESTMIDSSGVFSPSSKDSALSDPGGKVGEKKGKKEKTKKTKLEKMYQQASKSTKAISRLFFHSPPSGGAVKASATKTHLPLVIPPEGDSVIDPFASGKFVSSYGLSPVETSPPASLPVTKSFKEAEPTKNQLLQPPLLHPPDISAPPRPRTASHVLEGQNSRGRGISFPNADTSNSMSPPPTRRTRSISVSATHAAKPFTTDKPPPMPQMRPSTAAGCPSVSCNLPMQTLPSPLPVSSPKLITRHRTSSLSEAKFRATIQPTKAVPLKNDVKPSSNNDDSRPFPVFPMGAASAVAVQTQPQISDSDLTQDGKVGSSTLLMSLSTGHYLKSSVDGERRPAVGMTRNINSAVEFQTRSEPESVSKSLPLGDTTGPSARVHRREGSGLTPHEVSSLAPYQQDPSVTKPILPPLSTQNLSSSAISSDSETLVNGSSRNQHTSSLPRSPSLPDLRPGVTSVQPTAKDKLSSHSEVRRPWGGVHVRSPSLPNFSDRPLPQALPQALPASIIDRLKTRDRGTPRPKSRTSSMDSTLSNERPLVISEKAAVLGPNFPQSARRDAGIRAGSITSIHPPAMRERKNSNTGMINPTFRFGHTQTPVHPSVPRIQSGASRIESPPSPTTSLPPPVRKSLRSPSVPDLRARANTVSDNRNQPSTSTSTPSQTRHIQSHSHCHPIPVPPIPRIPDTYKPRSSAVNVTSEAAASSLQPANVNFCRPRLNLTRPKEISYPPSKRAANLLNVCFDEELVDGRGAGFTGDDDEMGKVSRTPSGMVSSSLDRRRVLHRFRSLSAIKGQGQGQGGSGGNLPPVPPLPSSPLPPLPVPPVSPLSASGMRDGSARGGMVIGAAL